MQLIYCIFIFFYFFIVNAAWLSTMESAYDLHLCQSNGEILSNCQPLNSEPLSCEPLTCEPLTCEPQSCEPPTCELVNCDLVNSKGSGTNCELSMIVIEEKTPETAACVSVIGDRK